MQLMPSTQTMLGVSNPFNPQHNVEAGARYLAMLKQTFSGNVQLALAAYNAGPQAVVAAGYTVPAIAETQQYVRCVFAAYEQYRQPGAAPFPHLRPLQPGTRTLAPSRRSLTPSVEARQTLVVSPLRLSSQVAQVGQRLTVELEATNTSKRSGHGLLCSTIPSIWCRSWRCTPPGKRPRCSSQPRPGATSPGCAANHRVSTLVESLAGLDPRGAPDGDYLSRAAPTARHDTARERGTR